jgi:hypothetical protein
MIMLLANLKIGAKTFCQMTFVMTTIGITVNVMLSVVMLSATMEQHTLKSVNNCLITDIYSYLETTGGQSSNLHLNVVHFLRQVLIRHLRQLKTAVFLHRCLIHAALLSHHAEGRYDLCVAIHI